MLRTRTAVLRCGAEFDADAFTTHANQAANAEVALIGFSQCVIELGLGGADSSRNVQQPMPAHTTAAPDGDFRG